MNNMQQLLNRAHKLQEKISQVQKELELKEVTGTSGAGAVNVIMSLKGTVQSVSIDKAVINPDDSEMLEDLIVAALNDARNKADKMHEEGMKEATGGLDVSKLTGGMF